MCLLSVTKEYLKSLGNSECSPQTFLENSGSLDKLLIIIRNEDIAAHVHKVKSLLVALFITVTASPPICSSGACAAAEQGSDQTKIMAFQLIFFFSYAA